MPITTHYEGGKWKYENEIQAVRDTRPETECIIQGAKVPDFSQNFVCNQFLQTDKIWVVDINQKLHVDDICYHCPVSMFFNK